MVVEDTGLYPYLISLQVSDVGIYVRPFLEKYDATGNIIKFIPGAITRWPRWFFMLYCYLGCTFLVKTEEQRTASFFQVSRDYGYASRNRSSDHMVHQWFLPVDSFQRKACDVLRDGDGIRIHLSASWVHTVRSRWSLSSDSFRDRCCFHSHSRHH